MSWDDDDDDWDVDVDLGLGSNKPGGAAEEEANFDDEEEVVEADPTPAPVKIQKPAKKKDDSKAKAKALSKAKQKELEAKLAAEAEAAKSTKPMTKEEKVAEKLRLQRLVEESDHAITNDLFQAKKEESGGKLNADAIQVLLQTVPLDTEEQFKTFATAIGRRVELADKPFLAKEFIKELGREIGRMIGGEDLAEVISVLGVVKNEKVKAQLNKKKKKGGKKFANVARTDEFDVADRGVGAGGGYNDDLDGDFM